MEQNIIQCDYCNSIKKITEKKWITTNLESIGISNKERINLETPQYFCCKVHLIKYIKLAVKEAKKQPILFTVRRGVLKRKLFVGSPNFPKYIDKPKQKDNSVFEINDLIEGGEN